MFRVFPKVQFKCLKILPKVHPRYQNLESVNSKQPYII